MMHFKIVTMNLLIIVHPFLVETIIYVTKPKAYLEAYISIRQLPLTVTSSKPVISPSQFCFFFLGKILRSNRYSRGTVLSHVGNSADSCGWRNKTIKLKGNLHHQPHQGEVCSLLGSLY